MADYEDEYDASIGVTLVRGCVVSTLPAQLGPNSINALRSRIMDAVQQHRAQAVLVDCGMLQVMDSAEFAELRAALVTAGLLGARSMVVGLRPGIVAHLINADVDVVGLETALTLEDGLDRMLATGAGFRS
jgi:anti-anti-sigma regulatory factor